jgi:hypothetical protein
MLMPRFGFGRPAPQMPLGAGSAPAPGAMVAPAQPNPTMMQPPPADPMGGDPGASMAPPAFMQSAGQATAPQPTAPQAIANGGAPISPLDIIMEQLSSGDGLLGYHHAHQRLLQQQQNEAYAARDAGMMDKAIAALGTGPDADKQAFALHHDPASFATSVNDIQKPQTVAAGASAGHGGTFGFTAPDPIGQSNAASAAATAANGAVSAGASAENARLAGLKTPSEIARNSAEAVAALINARKPSGASGPGLASPPGYH